MAYRIMRAASGQIEDILVRSARLHGTEAASRYDLLLATAMVAVGTDPLLPGSKRVKGLPSVRAYSLRLSRAKVEADKRVRTPRHLLIYRLAADSVVEILAVVHDRMVLSRAARRGVRSARDA